MSNYQQIVENQKYEIEPHKRTCKELWGQFKCYWWINFIQFGIEFDSLFLL